MVSFEKEIRASALQRQNEKNGHLKEFNWFLGFLLLLSNPDLGTSSTIAPANKVWKRNSELQFEVKYNFFVAPLDTWKIEVGDKHGVVWWLRRQRSSFLQPHTWPPLSTWKEAGCALGWTPGKAANARRCLENANERLQRNYPGKPPLFGNAHFGRWFYMPRRVFDIFLE